VIVCGQCGFENEDSDTFCGSCAAFLEWDGQKVREEQPPAALPGEPAPESSPSGWPEPAPKPSATPSATQSGAVAPTAPAPPRAEGPGSPVSPTTPRLDPPPPPPPTRPVAPAAGVSTLSPAEPGGPGLGAMSTPVDTEAVKPEVTRARRTHVRAAPTRDLVAGDKVCPQCGEGNSNERNFCRRCAAPLTEAQIVSARVPWYRRWWHKLTGRKVHAAGDRPTTRRRLIGGSGGGRSWLSSWVTRIVGLVVALFVILTFVGPWSHSIRHRFSTWFHDVKVTYTPIHATAAAATSAAAGHPARNLIDDASNTSWQAGTPSAHQQIVLTLPGSSKVARIGFLSGDQDTDQAYVTEPRPETIQLIFVGTKVVKDVTLKDTPDFQTFSVSASGASAVRLVIESTYPATGSGVHVSITEVELFAKS
jgi:hypothetical protein